MKTVEELLEEDPRSNPIPCEAAYEMPDIDYTRFAEPEKARIAIEIMHSYLTFPCNVDDFKNHKDRIEWRKDLINKASTDGNGLVDSERVREANEYLCRDALKLNAVAAVLNASYYLSCNYTGRTEADVTRFYELQVSIQDMRGMVRDYEERETMDESAPDKLDFVKELKRRAYDLLEFLSR